ncbi:DUF2199 domain-containing protein [Occultella aeris]
MCSVCGAQHSGLNMVFGPSGPDSWAAASPEDRARGEISRDVCVLPTDEGTFYFIRGELRVPVTDAVIGDFAWSVWASLSERNMQLAAKRWDDPNRVNLDPMFGWLNNRLAPFDPPTMNLAVNVHTRPPGVVPLIELDPSSDHPLALEQQEGITLHRVAELNRLLLAE